LPEPRSPRQLLERLVGPPDSLHAVTIPEGRTVQEVVSLLAAAGLGSEETFQTLVGDPHFLASEGLPSEGAEGYLFPDTYSFPLGTPPERVLGIMIRRFHEVFTPEMAARAAQLGLTPYQAVTLASLVEEETARPEERPLVAAVYLNRLKRGMPLQADPTVLYGPRPGDRRLSRGDLSQPGPYNTYTTLGLPPTPIANPGRASLEAAVNPAQVPYLYFVARGDGSHEFNTELAQHNAAVAKLRHLERVRPSGARSGPGVGCRRLHLVEHDVRLLLQPRLARVRGEELEQRDETGAALTRRDVLEAGVVEIVQRAQERAPQPALALKSAQHHLRRLRAAGGGVVHRRHPHEPPGAGATRSRPPRHPLRHPPPP